MKWYGTLKLNPVTHQRDATTPSSPTPPSTIPTSGAVKMIGWGMIGYGAVRTKYIV